MLHILILLIDAFRIIAEQNKMGRTLEDLIQAIILFTNLPLDITLTLPFLLRLQRD